MPPEPQMVVCLRSLLAIWTNEPNAGNAATILNQTLQPGVMSEFYQHPDCTLELIEDVVNMGQQLASAYADAQSPNPVHIYGPMSEAFLGAYWGPATA